MPFEKTDRVKIKDKCEKTYIGIIVSINEFREPDMRYAVMIEGYNNPTVFCSEEQIVEKIEEE